MSSLEFDRPATRWLESLPLGNGALGAMVDGGVPELRIGLNEQTAWSGSPRSESSAGLISAAEASIALAASRAAIEAGDPVAAERRLAAAQASYTQAFLPVGSLIVRRRTGMADYRRRLDLSTGVHELRSGDLRERVVVSAPHGVLALESTAELEAELESPLRELGRRRSGDDLVVLLRLPSDVAPGHEPGFPAASWSDAPGDALEAAVVVRRLRDDGRGKHLLLLAISTTFAALGRSPGGTAEDAAEKATAVLDAAERDGADAVFRAAVEDHAALFGRSEIRLAGAGPRADAPTDERLRRAFGGMQHPLEIDPGLAGLLFDVGRYLAIASSRPGGLPATLQGIWNDSMQPPWSSNYTININTQMNHWSAQVANLPETAEPYRDLVLALADAGRATARRLYDAPGWVAHHNTDAWLFSNPVGAGRGDARWTAWPMAGPWLVRGVWDAIEFGAGDEEAAALWPAIRGAAEFALAWHHRDGNGAWVTSPATSPENAFRTEDGVVAAVDTTTAMDQQLLADLFDITVRLATRLGHEDDPVALAAARRAPLVEAEPAATSDGIVREWAVDRDEEDPRHRHLSPLYGLYPGPGRWSEQGRAAAAATLERRGDDSSGWSLVWKMALWARLRRGDKVSDLLRLLFRDATDDSGPWAGGLYPNLFAAHPPFQIDANLAFPAVLIESLLQSHDGIELLPALPAELRSGSARGLVARPGVEVELRWRDGALESATLVPRKPGTLSIRYRGRTLRLHVADAIQLTPSDFEGSA